MATLAEEIDAAGEERIRALLTVAGNPVLSTPNGARLARALESLEFMVSVDIYVNDRRVARGEVLVVNDNFCVRVSEIIQPIGDD